MAALDAYSWKDAGFGGQLAVIMGYGAAVADVILQGLAEAGCKIAIVSRTQSKLDDAAARHNNFDVCFIYCHCHIAQRPHDDMWMPLWICLQEKAHEA